jgi:allantoinase
VHLSSSDSIPQIVRAKEKGLPVTVETGQHYLYFNAESIPDGETQFKCAPPIREKENNEKLWQAMKDGIIDFVATDHSPAPPLLKLHDSGNFIQAWGGIASLQFALPALWTAANQRGCTTSDVAMWLCQNPSPLAGYSDTKGLIAKGYDADLVIWDEKESFKVDEAMILHKHKICPYIGETLFGVVKQTYLSGEKVFEEGSFILNRGKLLSGSNTSYE